MRTHGHREGITKHWGLLWGKGEGQWEGSWGGVTWGEMPDIGDGEEGSKPHCRVLCMQLFLTCTPKPKMQKRKCFKK